ncbi:MAG: alkaline phosphatase D family protein [Candidatus Rokubacteria bacterium]|nr:alkaline phosphatase D family protein [Candidatus Rokubacteria bacterium]
MRPPAIGSRSEPTQSQAGGVGRAVVVLLLLLLFFRSAAADPRVLVTVGEVTDQSAVIWGRGFKAGPLVVEARREGGSARVTASTQLSRERDFTGKLLLTDLVPSARYVYRLRHGGTEVSGAFVTAPRGTDPRGASFLWSGDLGGRNHCRHLQVGYPIFRAMASLRPEFFLFVGDTIYADHRCGGPGRVPGYDFVAKTLEEFREKHRYNRADPRVQAFFRTTSVYTIWDDHEVRNDFAGPGEPLMPVGRQAFIEYWPILTPVEEPGRLYRKVRWGKLLELFILDTRQYRSDNHERDGPRKTMLGLVQRRWLVDGVADSDAVWKVVVSSVPLAIPTGRHARDSWSGANVWGFPEEDATGFAVERDAILQMFRTRKVKNLLWVTADVHRAELIRHHPWPDFSFHEFIAGPLSASRGRPWLLDTTLNPRSLFGLGDVDNFGQVTVAPGGVSVRIFDALGTMRFQHTITPE